MGFGEGFSCLQADLNILHRTLSGPGQKRPKRGTPTANYDPLADLDGNAFILANDASFAADHQFDVLPLPPAVPTPPPPPAQFSAPRLAGIKVSSTQWSDDFLNFVDPVNGTGYSIPTGPDQFNPMPWNNINQVIFQFNEAVTGPGGAPLSLSRRRSKPRGWCSETTPPSSSAANHAGRHLAGPRGLSGRS